MSNRAVAIIAGVPITLVIVTFLLNPAYSRAPTEPEARLRIAVNGGPAQAIFAIDKPQPGCGVLVHILDTHFVPKLQYLAELSAIRGRALSEIEGDAVYAEFLEEVQAIQAAQSALLRTLIATHGVQAVGVEGLSAKGVGEFRKRIERLTMDLAELKLLQREASEALAAMRKGNGNDQDVAALKETTAFLTKTAKYVESESLDLGAAAMLCAGGILKDILPLEDADAHAASEPRLQNGRLLVDPAAAKRRHEAIVENATRCGGRVAVIVLGSDHDLAVEARAKGWAYWRVECK